MEKAKGAGLDVVALTDHDTTVGWDEAQEAADRIGITLVKGIEVSTELQHKSIHLLGYNIDPADAALMSELAKVIDGRSGRVPKFVARFNAIGIDVTEEEILAKVGDADAVGRPHLADVLIDKGVVTSRDEAFRDYLSPGMPGYVGRYSIPTDAAIRLVKAAGGKAVLAHPWSRGSHQVLDADRIAQLVEAGLDGIEVDHPDHDTEQRDELHKIAAVHDLVVTGSSDHHGVGKSEDFRLGVNTTSPDELQRLLG
jgi:predicted metal-dependent phosphoesterase TrpH